MLIFAEYAFSGVPLREYAQHSHNRRTPKTHSWGKRNILMFSTQSTYRPLLGWSTVTQFLIKTLVALLITSTRKIAYLYFSFLQLSVDLFHSTATPRQHQLFGAIDVSYYFYYFVGRMRPVKARSYNLSS